jgi:hypothetical protein
LHLPGFVAIDYLLLLLVLMNKLLNIVFKIYFDKCPANATCALIRDEFLIQHFNIRIMLLVRLEHLIYLSSGFT